VLEHADARDLVEFLGVRQVAVVEQFNVAAIRHASRAIRARASSNWLRDSVMPRARTP